MSEDSPAPRSLKDPVRIVYHAGDRTFARLFNEHSLEQIKDVVRRKLGLGAGTDVLLKQMGSGPLLDLDDDGDFQAFRVHLKSSVSADIQVTVGLPQGPAVPPPVEPQLRSGPLASEPITTASEVSPSREPASAIVSSGTNVQREVARTAGVSTISTETPLTRKRKASFDHGIVAASDLPAEQPSDQPSAHPATDASVTRKSLVQKRAARISNPSLTTEQRAQRQPAAVTPVASAKTAESPATSKLHGAEEPPKKKQKKELTKKKEAGTKETARSSAPEPPAPIRKVRKSLTLDRGSKADASALNDSETSEPLVKKQRKRKMDDITSKKKSSASMNKDGMDQLISQPSNSVDEIALQAASSGEHETLEIRKSDKTVAPKGTVCASIPQTSASTSVRSEVAAAILSGYLSKASETVPPAPPTKPRPLRRVTKKSSASSSALPTESTSVSDTPANETRDLPAEHRPEEVVPTGEPQQQQTPDLNGPPCPICLGEPFHIRYCCPTVLKGPDAVRERLEELKRADIWDQQSLIKQLEGLLCDSEVAPGLSLNATPTADVQSEKVLSPPNASLPRTPNIPINSYLAEVTVESRDEGSSSESSDDTSDGGLEHHELSAPQRRKTPDEWPLPSNDGMETAVRGPVSKWKSVLDLIDCIAADEGDEGSSSEEDEAKLEEDTDETGRSRRRYSKRITRSSDLESEEEESRSPSPSCSCSDSDEGAPSNPGPSAENPNKSAMESAEHQEGDVVMTDSVNPPILEGQDDDSNNEAHVGSEDRMAVDEPTGESGAAIVAKEQFLPQKASDLQHSNPPSDEPQQPAKIQVESVPAVSEVPKEVEVDPMEPADDFAPSTVSRSTNADPILEVPLEDIGSLFATQPTPTPGVSKRIKTRNGQVLDDEADHPVLLEELVSEVTDKVTPTLAKGKLRRKVTETPASQEPVSIRRSPRFNSLFHSTSTPAAVALLNHRIKSRKTTKTPAKQPEERSEVSKSNGKDDPTQDGAHIAPTPTLTGWETLAEPSSPSVQLDEPSILMDELMSSSPQSDDISIRGCSNEKAKKGRSRKFAASSQAEGSQGKERLFDLTPSQIPFPYSQNRINLAFTPLPNEGTTDSEEEPEVTTKRTKMPVKYRPLSQLASQAFFSPSLPTPSSSNKSMTNGKAKKRAADEDSSSSSSSDEDEDGDDDISERIPRGRWAGSVLETKKRKSLLSGI